MKWEKKGLLFAPNTDKWWQQHYGILPTPVHLEELNRIRIYFSTTCKDRFGRVTFMEVNENDPSDVLYVHDDYILDVGEIGAFDDCGVNVSAVYRKDDLWYMYYAGYQRHFRTPYSVLSGLAISNDGVQFARQQKNAVLERTHLELSLRSAPTVLFEDGRFKMWYVSDFGWRKMDSGVHKDKLMPQYCLRYATSDDGRCWQPDAQPALYPAGDEFGFGRPYIVKSNGGYELYYSIRSIHQAYRIGYAVSEDGHHWVRKDEDIGIDVSAQGWDAEMICYPAVLTVKNATYLFYNGNKNGESGFGYAALLK